MSSDSRKRLPGGSARSAGAGGRPPDDFDGATETTSGAEVLKGRAGRVDAVAPRSSRGRSRSSGFTRAKTGKLRRAGLVDGRYELEEMISKGGMGRVFRARHRDLGRLVALKLVLEGFSEDQELRALFFKEARLASSLSHPNIINVTDFGLDQDLGYYVVMDLLEGETLRARSRKKRPNLRFCFDVVDQAAGAVRYIHGRNIVHCDLKPENMFLTRVEGEPRRGNVLKLLDFGLSWRGETIPDQKLGGTPPYLAPERLRGQPPDPLCDMYSLGMILYELITNQLPYTGSIAEMIDKQLNGPPPRPPSKLAAEPVDERVDQLILRSLARNPAHRHPSAEAFQFELRAVMGMMGMQMRRHVATVADSTPTLDAEIIFQSVLDSPVPLAIFDLSGSVRLANRSFVETLEGVYVPLANFNELAITRRHAELHEVFQRAVDGHSATSRVVLAGAEGGEHSMILWVAPLKRDDVVEGVHMTVVLGGAA
jgi:serine/threonine protein kinase